MLIGQGGEGVGVRLDSEGGGAPEAIIRCVVHISSFDVFRFFTFFFAATCNFGFFLCAWSCWPDFPRRIFFFRLLFLCSYLYGTYTGSWLVISLMSMMRLPTRHEGLTLRYYPLPPVRRSQMSRMVTSRHTTQFRLRPDPT